MDHMEERILALHKRSAKILDHRRHFKTAVILPLIRQGDEFVVLFEKRSMNLTNQPGEICFPGGRCEPEDGGARNTAIRETCEELGLTPADLEVLAELDIMVSPFGILIIPFLAIIDNPENMSPNPDEVEKVFCVPLKYLMENKPLRHQMNLSVSFPDDFPLELIPQGKNYPFRQGILPQYFYIWEGEVIWGLTARILHHFIEMIKGQEERFD